MWSQWTDGGFFSFGSYHHAVEAERPLLALPQAVQALLHQRAMSLRGGRADAVLRVSGAPSSGQRAAQGGRPGTWRHWKVCAGQALCRDTGPLVLSPATLGSFLRRNWRPLSSWNRSLREPRAAPRLCPLLPSASRTFRLGWSMLSGSMSLPVVPMEANSSGTCEVVNGNMKNFLPN